MHTGPVIVRWHGERVTVLCPRGHVVTAANTGPTFAGSHLAARIGQHQSRRDWIVDCDGA